MRLHHLSLTAFGPFPGQEEVDFDELCDAGLFLLTGPTGAGKTTVLDAVCFALYGTVPGARGVKVLKSQHATADVRPEVVLDFSVRGRTFTVRRTPEWSRPKRRGTGTTTENATASLLESIDGELHLLSSRAQDVGHFVGELVGMQSTQFVQVAMLPQGGFQRFLRATSQERHAVLQHLFRTDRFARIEEWVHEHSRSLEERSATGEREVVRLLDALADRSGCEVPEELTGPALRTPDLPERARAWAHRLLAEARDAEHAARGTQRDAAGAAAEARARHQEALRVRDLRVRGDAARSTLAELGEQEDEAAEARSRIAASDRAARCTPLLTMLASAQDDAAAAEAAWRDADVRLREQLERTDLHTADAPEVPAPVTVEGLVGAERAARAQASRLETLLPRERELAEKRQEARSTAAELDSTAREREAVRGRLDRLPSVIDRARERRDGLDGRARRTEALGARLREVDLMLDAAQEERRCAAEVEQLQDAERTARDRAADARDRVQTVTERRLAGIAAELAGRLTAGEPCQVCGSREHPEPAPPGPHPVTETEQAEADAALAETQRAHAEASGSVARAEERRAGLLARAGHRTVESLRHEADALRAEHAEAAVAGRELPDAEAELAALVEEERRLVTTVHELTTRVATLSQALETLRTRVDALRVELGAAGECVEAGDAGDAGDAGEPGLSLITRIEALRTVARAAEDACTALRHREATADRLGVMRDRVEAAARQHGFADLAEMGAAVLDDADRARLERLLERRAAATASARAVLAEPEVAAAGDLPPPDVEARAGELAAAEDRADAAARELHQAEGRVEALRRHHAGLAEALERWAPRREEFLRASSMAKLVRGMGGDNQLQLRLSAYVLATRLDQVVAAANERLGHMRDQRYLLQRTDRAARKGSPAGLGLEVVDQWTGDVRDPATLSGGETFVVSLSLALGLADVVTHEAGGTEIETLFVDEGFGSLDADTLDDVMDRLDELRTGGRAVGVVSHVNELRDRIPTQLHVGKRRDGSALAVRNLVG